MKRVQLSGRSVFVTTMFFTADFLPPLFSNDAARGGRGGGREGSRGGGRGSNRNNVRSRNKVSANADASQGNEGSGSPTIPKRTIPQSEYDKVKGTSIRCLDPGQMWYPGFGEDVWRRCTGIEQQRGDCVLSCEFYL